MENYIQKITELDNIISRNPNHGEAYYNKARFIQQYFTDRDFLSDAEKETAFHEMYENANMAIECSCHIADAYFLRALANLAYGEDEKAESDFEQAVTLDATHAKANHNLAIIYLQRSEFEKALDYVNRSIEADPGEGANYHLRGQALGMLNDREGMDADYKKTVELLGEQDYIYHSRAIIHINNDRYEEALTDLGRVLELDPANKDCYLLKAFLQEKSGDKIAGYTTQIEMAESEYFEFDANLCASLYCNRGVARLDVEGDIDNAAAMADFNKSLEYAPDMTLALYNRASLNKTSGNLQQALDDAQLAITMENIAEIDATIRRLSKKLVVEIKEEMGIKVGLWERVKNSIFA